MAASLQAAYYLISALAVVRRLPVHEKPNTLGGNFSVNIYINLLRPELSCICTAR
jgi:hypothetical protein